MVWFFKYWQRPYVHKTFRIFSPKVNSYGLAYKQNDKRQQQIICFVQPNNFEYVTSVAYDAFYASYLRAVSTLRLWKITLRNFSIFWNLSRFFISFIWMDEESCEVHRPIRRSKYWNGAKAKKMMEKTRMICKIENVDRAHRTHRTHRTERKSRQRKETRTIKPKQHTKRRLHVLCNSEATKKNRIEHSALLLKWK